MSFDRLHVDGQRGNDLIPGPREDPASRVVFRPPGPPEPSGDDRAWGPIQPV